MLVWEASCRVGQTGSFSRTSSKVWHLSIGGSPDVRCVRQSAKRRVEFAKRRAGSSDCVKWAYSREPIVGRCPKRDALWRLSPLFRAKSKGATRGLIGGVARVEMRSALQKRYWLAPWAVTSKMLPRRRGAIGEVTVGRGRRGQRFCKNRNGHRLASLRTFGLWRV